MTAVFEDTILSWSIVYIVIVLAAGDFFYAVRRKSAPWPFMIASMMVIMVASIAAEVNQVFTGLIWGFNLVTAALSLVYILSWIVWISLLSVGPTSFGEATPTDDDERFRNG